jgi:mannose-6-phosphate isomerase
VKLIFTSERLSVQVHPDDAYAAAHHQSLGKTEAWYIVSADSGAEVAVGFREHLTPDRAREAAQTGEIEHLMAWHKVKAGDVVFVPAGTVHAIGAGLTICEVQENSDVTYRLYDYGRPRELHLEHGMAVAKLEPYSFGSATRSLGNGRDSLVDCPYFRIERLQPQASITIDAGLPAHAILICVRGEGRAGEAWFVPAGSESLSIEGAGSEWIITYTADQPFTGIQVS